MTVSEALESRIQGVPECQRGLEEALLFLLDGWRVPRGGASGRAPWGVLPKEKPGREGPLRELDWESGEHSRLFPRRFPHRPCIASLHLLWPLVITPGCLLMSSCNEHPATVLTKAWTWTTNHQVGWDRTSIYQGPEAGGRRVNLICSLGQGSGSGKGQALN